MYGNWNIRYHGNYCGPGWSDGAHHDSVCGFAPAIDEFDQTCKEHDCSYFKYGPNRQADDRFFADNIGRGVKRTVAAIAVSSQRNKMRKGRTFFDRLHDVERPPTPGGNHIRFSDDSTNSVSSSVNNLLAIGTMSDAMSIASRSTNRAELDSTLGGSFSKAPLSETIFRNIATRPSGLTEHTEIIGALTGGDIVWLGHATMCYTAMLYSSARAVTKYALAKMGISFDNWSDTVDTGLANVQLVLFYQASSTSGTVVSVSQAVAAADTYEGLATRVRNLLIGVYTAAPDGYLVDLRIQKPVGADVVPLANIRMAGMRVNFFGRSNLAIQNTSQAQVGTNDIDDVEHIAAAALTGKIYHFKGNFGRKIGRNRDPLDITASNYVTGNSALLNPSGTAAYSEPVHGFQFYGCKKVRALQMNPGQIKTDQFSSMVSTTFNQLWKNYSQRIATNYTHNYGHFHLFAIEKKVMISGGRDINVSVNCDVQLGTFLEERLNFVVNPLTSHDALST